MKCLRYVCLISVITTGQWMLGQSGGLGSDQQLQRGVSVQMAVANDSQPVPAADEQGAWIVSVSGDGTLYFGTDSVTHDTLVQQMISHPRRRDLKLYIKADARTKYANVQKALDAARAAGFDEPVLLTTREELPTAGSRVAPEGFEVRVGALESGGEPTVLELLRSEQGPPALRIDGRKVSWDHLRSSLSQTLGTQKENVTLVRADAELEFAQLVYVIDACRSVGAKVVLVTPKL